MRPAHPSASGGQRLTILFEGRPVPANPGDTVAAALLRNGVRVFSRGPKYHRPRGPFCLTGSCAQCHMRIGGEPNVPACTTTASDGLVVERQNALGSADTDLLRAVDYLYPHGIDHHHLMTRFRPLNVAASAVARRLAGLGTPPAHALPITPGASRAVSLVVVGAGRTGLAIAAAAARAGLRPLLVDEAEPAFAEPYDPSRLSDVLASGEAWFGASLVWLGEESGARRALVGRGDSLVSLEFDHAVLATGEEEAPTVFEGNDLPGHYAGRGLLRFIRRFGFAPGDTAVVVRTAVDDDAMELARMLRGCGVRVAAVLDSSDATTSGDFRDSDLPIHRGQLLRAHGGQHLRSIDFLHCPDPTNRSGGATEQRVDCDLLAVCGNRSPRWELAGEAGAAIAFRESPPGFVPVIDDEGRSSIPWLSVAGRAAGQALDESGRRRLASRIADRLVIELSDTRSSARGAP